MNSTIRIEGAAAYARATGEPLTHDIVRVPFPVEEDLIDPEIGARYTPSPNDPRAPLASAACITHVESLLPRHDKGTPCTNFAQISRRLADLPFLEARPLSAFEDTRADFWALARLALERLALPVDAFLEHARGRVPLTNEEQRGIAQAVADERTGIYAWDERGRELDAAVEHAHAAALEEKHRQAREAEERSRPVNRTLRELGLIAYEVALDAFDENLATGGRYFVRNAPAFAFDLRPEDALIRTATHAVFAWDASMLFGFEPSNAATHHAGRWLADDFRITLPRFEVDARTLQITSRSVGVFLTSRGLAPEAVDVSKLRDLRAPEGEHAAKVLRAKLAELSEQLTTRDPATGRFGGMASLFGRLAIEIGARALMLRKPIVKAAYYEAVEGARRPLPGVERTETVFRTTPTFDPVTGEMRPGDEVPAHLVRRMGSGTPARVIGRGPAPAGYGNASQEADELEFLKEELRTVVDPGKLEPPPITEEYFEVLYAQALEGKAPMVAIDELYTVPEETFLERFTSFFDRNGGRDGEWTRLVERTVEDKQLVTSDELEAAVIAAKLHEGEFATKEHQKVKRIMRSLGWIKKTPTIDGQRRNAFVRGDE